MKFIHVCATYPDMEQRDAHHNENDVRAFRFAEIDGKMLAVILIYERGSGIRLVSDSVDYLKSLIR